MMTTITALTHRGSPIRALIEPPKGYSWTISRTGSGKPLSSIDLYSATLYTLLHFCLMSYEAIAEPYTTQGPEPLGTVSVNILPLVTSSSYAALNCHVVWGIYWSIIAFNSPEKSRRQPLLPEAGGMLSFDTGKLDKRRDLEKVE